ncbi:YihY/virulence factor BrkB family protein [Mycoplasma sp. 2045]|uniref:YihY/virulence factor BrkB family protein n=1 Tax=Mycoplasma sp. 2045 TaxID=2967301 RepID=UPI00211CFD01|nr:YihY/virulence factor BrkB family protein [Mycoplasma sp. 2045]UUM20600.1 YihY/virulence factor BrkB family protein [Mycoplasma sp. 2045]
MSLLNKKTNANTDYNKLIKLKNVTKKTKKTFHQNLIFPERFTFFSKIYEFIIKKCLIRFFASILIWVRNESDHRKRLKVVDNVYSKFTSSEYNFIWLSTAFYLLISFVPVIYVVFLLNIFFGFIPGYNNLVGSNFQDNFITIIMSRFIPGSQNYLQSIQMKDQGTSAFNLQALLPNIFLFLSSLYISSTGYGKLISANNYIYKHNKIGSYWGNKIKGLFLVLFVSILFWFFSTIDIIIETKITEKYNGTIWLNTFVYILISFVFVFVMLVGLFKLIPSFKLTIKSIYKGAILSTTPIVLLVLLFKTINQHINYDKYGGPVGFFLTIAFFINWVVYFMFLGIAFNNAYYKNYISERTITKRNWFI